MALLSFNTLIACLPCPRQSDCFIKRLCLVREPHLVLDPSPETTEDREELVTEKYPKVILHLRAPADLIHNLMCISDGVLNLIQLPRLLPKTMMG